MTPRITAAQRRILSAALTERQAGRVWVATASPRTVEALISRGWIEVDGYHFGPLYRLTESGTAVALEAARRRT